MEELIQRITFLRPEDGETIVLTIKPNTDLSQLQYLMQMIQQQFPKNKVIALPHTLEINSMETESLIHYLQEGDKGTIVE